VRLHLDSASLLPAPACPAKSNSKRSFATKRLPIRGQADKSCMPVVRHGIVLDRHSTRPGSTYRKQPCWGRCVLLQQYFCQIPPLFCAMFRFTSCRNRMISLPGRPVDHHEEYYFRRYRKQPGYEGKSKGLGIEEVRGPVGRVISIFSAPRLTTNHT
jgi:hypothetical protein